MQTPELHFVRLRVKTGVDIPVSASTRQSDCPSIPVKEVDMLSEGRRKPAQKLHTRPGPLVLACMLAAVAPAVFAPAVTRSISSRRAS